MKLKRYYLVAVFFLLNGCGGSSGGGTTPTTQTGVFLDSPVANVGYRTQTQEGVTNALGEYLYVEGETVTFFVGDLEFPTVTATGIVTPLNLANTQNTNDSKVINIVRLLQTLDEDGNPDNGITITETAKASATQVDFDLTEAAFASSTAVTSLIANSGSINVSLISIDDAISHLEGALAEQGLLADAHIGAWFLGAADATDYNVLVFVDEQRYFLGHSKNTEAAPNETAIPVSGEYGTYTWNYSTNRFSFTPIGESDFDGGIDQVGNTSPGSFELNGDVLIINEDNDTPFTMSRI